jgi:hypothetical protein
MDGTRRLGASNTPRTLFSGRCLTVVGHIDGGYTPDVGLRILKFGDVFVCGPPTIDRTVKWMARADSACRIGLVRCLQGLSDSSGCKLMGVIPLMRVSEFRKLGTFLLVAAGPGSAWPNGCHDRIQRVE